MAKSPINLTNEQRLKVYKYALQEIESDLLKLEGRPDNHPKGLVTGLCYAFNFGLRMVLPENPVIQIASIDEAFLQKVFPEIFIKYKPKDYDSSVRMYWWPLTREGLEMRKNIIITEAKRIRELCLYPLSVSEAFKLWDYNKPRQ